MITALERTKRDESLAVKEMDPLHYTQDRSEQSFSPWVDRVSLSEPIQRTPFS